MDNKQIAKSAKKIGKLITILETIVNYILKENHKLQSSIEVLKTKQEFHQTTIQVAVNRIDEISEAIIAHEDEIQKNLKLADKFKDFLQ